jgi:hypothetical protein
MRGMSFDSSLTAIISAAQRACVILSFFFYGYILSICIVACGNSDDKKVADFVEIGLEARQDDLQMFVGNSSSLFEKPSLEDSQNNDSRSESDSTLEEPKGQASADESTFVVSGCSSGYSAIFRFQGGSHSLVLAKLDANCVVSLRSFRWDGRVWTKQGGGDFSGEGTAEFVSDQRGPNILVSNPRNLSRTVRRTDRVVFHFKFIALGKDAHLFKTGLRGEVPSLRDSRPGPKLQWPAALLGLSLFKDRLRIYLQCMGRLSLSTEVGASECIIEDSKNRFPRQSLADYYFLISQEKADSRPSLHSLIFSFMTHWPQKVVTVKSKEQIWHDKDSGQGGVFVDIPLTPATERLFESNCIRLLILHKPRWARVGHWAFTWLDFSLGYAGSACTPETEMPTDYEPDYDTQVD